MRQFSEALSREMNGIPELRTVRMTEREPLANSHWSTSMRQPYRSPDRVSRRLAGLFRCAWHSLVGGRNFQNGDETRFAIILNEIAARRYFPNENPLGKTIVTGSRTREIVGVARDAYISNLDAVVPQFFQPFTGKNVPKLLVRSASSGTIDTIGQNARRLETRSRTQASPLSENLDQKLTTTRIGAGMAGALGIFALVLACIGMAGAFAYVVQQRRAVAEERTC